MNWIWNLNRIIEKCGGPGSGVPGPCPGPKKPKKGKTKLKPLTDAEYEEHRPDTRKASKDERERDEVEETLEQYRALGYLRINGMLRDDPRYKSNYDETPAMAVRTKRDVKNLDKVMKVSKRLKRDTVVYRGTNAKRLLDVSPGDVIEDKGFVSTSTKKSVAEDFGDTTSPVYGGAIISIKVRKGTKVSAISARDDGWSVGSREKEILLPRGSRFKVLKKKRVSERRLEVQVVLLRKGEE